MSKRTVLITGCSPGGIGHALAREFHSQGLHVFATARKISTISDLAELGITTLPLEVTDSSSISTLKDSISSHTHGTLDILVNNAGRNYTVPALDASMDEIEATFATNVFAVMSLCQTFTPLLLASPNPGATIVQIGSLAAIMPYVFGSIYNASKAALHAYSATLRVELAPFGVRVLTVVTGGVQSNIARTHRTLPKDSLYLPVEKEYVARLTHSQANAIPNERYARSVVREVLRGRSDTLWEGGKSWLVYWVSFLPRWVMDIAMTRMFKLWKLKGADAKKLR